MNSSAKLNVSIYGVGSFGFALLKHLDNSHMQAEIKAYDINTEILNCLNEEKRHPFFDKSVKISKRVSVVFSPEQLLEDCDILILAVSSESTREAVRAIKPSLSKPIVILNTAKALDYKTGLRLSEIIDKELVGSQYTYGVLAGGTIAQDLLNEEPLGIDLACKNTKIVARLEDIFESGNLSVYTTTDLVGVEYAGALKNVVAIVAGITKGLGFSYGSETHIISRLAEVISKACIQLGANQMTFSIGSQCWGNDLWMSCTGNTRNREFGIMVGSGRSPGESLNEMVKLRKTVEGLTTLKIVNDIPEINSIELLRDLHKLIISQTMNIQQFKEKLLEFE